MNKEKLITDILAYLNHELSATLAAAQNAHLAATDDQSVAETQYDTLAIEAGYLAEGQARRVQEIQQAVTKFKSLDSDKNDIDEPVKLGSLVQLENDKKDQHWFFIAPAAGGYKCKFDGQKYTVITPQSPMGKALIGKYQDDDIELIIGTNKICDFIAAVY
ncbi:MAG: GreA/GreB family elongation factor [Colwellia sp.]|nr:GreA/GreB family elongation factor [Colwellia sp.]